MIEVQIDKGIPLPKKKNHKTNNVYPWRDMEVGDSFLVLDPPKAFRQQVSSRNRMGEEKFVYRTTPEGVRVWRTA